MPDKETKKKLTIKQKKFVKAYVANDGNGTQAALESYNVSSPEVAHAVAYENLSKPSIREAIETALEKHEITLDAAIAPIADGLKASKTFTVDESVVEVVDHSTRLKASGMALKLLGAEKNDTASSGNTFNFINNANFNSKDYIK